MANTNFPNVPNQNQSSSPIDDYALARIDFRVRQLRYQFDLSDEDQADLRNDMVAELLSAFERFNPSKSKRETFTNRVLDRFVLYVTRRRCTWQRRSSDSPIGLDDVHVGFQPRANDPGIGELDEQDLRELRLDLIDVIAQMPERLQRATKLLMVYPRKEVAVRIGVHRCSMTPIIARIREHFEEAGLDDWLGGRNNSGPAADVEGAPKEDKVPE